MMKELYQAAVKEMAKTVCSMVLLGVENFIEENNGEIPNYLVEETIAGWFRDYCLEEDVKKEVEKMLNIKI